MVIEFFEYIGRNLKLAAKNVKANVRQYACFFAAFFIIQVFFATLTVILYNNDKTEWMHVQEEYDYHIMLKSINDYQMLIIENNTIAVFSNDIVFDVVRTAKHVSAFDGEERYDVYLKLKGKDLDFALERFQNKWLKELNKYTEDGEKLSYVITPLLNFSKNLAVNRIIYVISIIVLIALSIFLLVVLYNIRINHYKFQFGIYLSFGADFKKLFETAFWEMFIIWAVPFIPATGVSVLIAYIILHVNVGLPFSCPIWTLLLTVLYGFVVMLVSVWFPMRLVSIKAPMSLIISQDNSNLVTSPRRSLNIFGTKFPLQYELFSTWRFRKYNLRLLVSAIIFTSLFICGLYVAEITRTTLSMEKPQFKVDLSATGISFDSMMRDEVYSIKGITLVDKSNKESAANIASYIAVDPKYVLPFANLVVPDNNDDIRVTNQVEYRTVDEDVIKTLEQYKYTGDLYSAINNERTVIVADSINNIRRFNYKVGDKITIAVKVGQMKAVDSNLTGKALLRQQLQYYIYDSYEFTIGAIIYDIPTLKMPLYLNSEDFSLITGKEANYYNLDVYVDQTLSVDEVREIENQLREWGLLYGYVSVTNTHALSLNVINEDKQFDEIFTLVATLLLTISPMIWFFSQTLYYLKREDEFTILQSMGAVGSEIRRLYISGGITMSILAFIFCIGLGYLLSFLLYFFVNVTIPKWTQTFIRYEFYMPWYAIVLSIVISVACGFLSAYIPYKSFMRRKSKILSVEYSDVSD